MKVHAKRFVTPNRDLVALEHMKLRHAETSRRDPSRLPARREVGPPTPLGTPSTEGTRLARRLVLQSSWRDVLGVRAGEAKRACPLRRPASAAYHSRADSVDER